MWVTCWVIYVMPYDRAGHPTSLTVNPTLEHSSVVKNHTFSPAPPLATEMLIPRMGTDKETVMGEAIGRWVKTQVRMWTLVRQVGVEGGCG